jgi:hypothetical protein
MSLIGDALRKARQEAAERDSDRKGVLFSAKIAEGHHRSGLGLGLILGALIAIFATVGGGLAVWWILGGDRTQASQASAATDGGSDRGQQPTSEDTETDVDPDEQPTPASDVLLSGDDAGDQRRQSSAAQAIETLEESGPIDHGPEARAAAGELPVGPDPVVDAVPDPAPPTSASEPETGFLGEEDGADVYLLEANLGDVALSLDFIVFRATDPYAEINGAEVHVGGTVAGFRVKAVAKDRVVLSDGRRTVVLRTP